MCMMTGFVVLRSAFFGGGEPQLRAWDDRAMQWWECQGTHHEVGKGILIALGNGYAQLP